MDCVSCHRSFRKPNVESDDGIQSNLCSDCRMMEDGW